MEYLHDVTVKNSTWWAVQAKCQIINTETGHNLVTVQIDPSSVEWIILGEYAEFKTQSQHGNLSDYGINDNRVNVFLTDLGVYQQSPKSARKSNRWSHEQLPTDIEV